MHRLVELSELEAGDEIIFSAHSSLRYCKVVRKPELSKSKHWKSGRQLYKAVKLSCRIDIKKRISASGKEWEYKQPIFEQDITKHNAFVYKDLEERHVFLVNRVK